MAAQFAQDAGLVIELQKYNNFVSCFECWIVSDFDCEKEVLFFGGETKLCINSILVWEMYKGWLNLKNDIHGINQILNIANGTITWNRSNDIKHVISALLPDLYPDHSTELLTPYTQLLMDYHLKDIPPKIEYDFDDLLNNYDWVKQIFVKD
eukprot:547586_1